MASSASADRRPREAVADSEAAARIARRYPGPRVPRTPVVALVVVLAVAGLTWTVWTGLHRASPPVTGQVTSFRTETDRVAVNLTVQRPDPTRPARCLVVAQAVDFEQVGQVWAEAPPADRESIDLQFDVRTFRRATTAKVDRCEIT